MKLRWSTGWGEWVGGGGKGAALATVYCRVVHPDPPPPHYSLANKLTSELNDVTDKLMGAQLGSSGGALGGSGGALLTAAAAQSVAATQQQL